MIELVGSIIVLVVYGVAFICFCIEGWKEIKVKNKHGKDMMPLWKYVYWRNTYNRNLAVVQAWDRREAKKLLIDFLGNTVTNFHDDDLKRMKARANSKVEKVVLST